MLNETATIILDQEVPPELTGLWRREEVSRRNLRTSIQRTYDSSHRDWGRTSATSLWEIMTELPKDADFGIALAIVKTTMSDSAYRFAYSLAQEAAWTQERSSTEYRQNDPTQVSGDLFATFGNVAVEIEWRTRNARRAELIHKRIASTLAPSESRELGELQRLADRRQQEKAPRDTRLLDDLERALGIDDD